MIPVAEVLRTRGRAVTIRCPYCRSEHRHSVERLGATERRAPACGLLRSADQRAAGYLFTTTERTPR